MSTAEVRKRLIEKIESTNDEKLLMEATRLLEIQLDEIETPFELSTELNDAIDEAQDQFKKGEFLTHDEANKEIGEWLVK